MTALEVQVRRRLAELRRYRTRRYALAVALAVLHLGLLGAAGWLVAVQIEPGPIRLLVLSLLGALAAIVLASPGSAAALVFIVVSGLSYLALSTLDTAIGSDGRAPHPYQVLGLATALFLGHALDGLREALPAGASVEAAVLTVWIRRAVEALVPGLVVGGLLVALPTQSAGGALWLVGALGLLLAVGLPVLALRPRPWNVEDSAV